MMKVESKIFGNKKKFAIEIKSDAILKKFYLRLWFDNKGVGDFKKSGSLTFIVKDFFKKVLNVKTLFEQKFYSMSDRQIFDDIVFDISIERPDDEEDQLMERMNVYALDLGDYQFSDFTFAMVNWEKEKSVKMLIYEMDGKTTPKFHSFAIATEYFVSVFKEFMRFVYENDLVPKENFFSNGFSYKDISEGNNVSN